MHSDARTRWLSFLTNEILLKSRRAANDAERRKEIMAILESGLLDVRSLVLNQSDESYLGDAPLHRLNRRDLWDAAVDEAMTANLQQEEIAALSEARRRQLSNRWFEAEVGAVRNRDVIRLSHGDNAPILVIVCEVLVSVPEGAPRQNAYATLWGKSVQKNDTSAIKRFYLGDGLHRYDEGQADATTCAAIERARERLRKRHLLLK